MPTLYVVQHQAWLIAFHLLCSTQLANGSPNFVTFMLCMLLQQAESDLSFEKHCCLQLYVRRLQLCVHNSQDGREFFIQPDGLELGSFQQADESCLEFLNPRSLSILFLLSMHQERITLLCFSPLLLLFFCCSPAVATRRHHRAGFYTEHRANLSSCISHLLVIGSEGKKKPNSFLYKEFILESQCCILGFCDCIGRHFFQLETTRPMSQTELLTVAEMGFWRPEACVVIPDTYYGKSHVCVDT